MKIVVVGNGEWDAAWGRPELEAADYVICADGGANSALKSGRCPDLVIGDFDSLTPENLEWLALNGVPLERYPREKDQTDLELALSRAIDKARAYADSTVCLLGGTGLRADHFLGNIALLIRFAGQGYEIHMLDPNQEMWVAKEINHISGRAGQEISLIPLSERVLVSTEGLFYPLDREYLDQDSPRGISNVLIAESAMIRVYEGRLLLSRNWGQ